MNTRSKIGLIVIALSAAVVTSNAYAITVTGADVKKNADFKQTFGSGSAVKKNADFQGSADFESIDSAVNANFYSEGGMNFRRIDLSGGCNPIVQCSSHPGFAGFSGNYMYGSGEGYFEMEANGDNYFTGLEFQIGTGFGVYDNFTSVLWSAFRDNVLVGSGTTGNSPGSVIGFSDKNGFDVLRYTNNESFNTESGRSAPAFDSVRAQFTSAPDLTVIPVPAALPLMASALGIFGIARRRNKSKAA